MKLTWLLLIGLLQLGTGHDDEDIAHMSSEEAAPRRREPSALIIGVKKGGTRALLQFIRMHPDVRAPGPEIHFFDKNYHRGRKWYRRRMPTSITGQITMEKTPGYFVDPSVPRRVRQFNPNIRLILVVRNPVVRALSDYAQAVENAQRGISKKRVKPISQLAFHTKCQYRSGARRCSETVDTNWSAVRIGLYARHLRNWLRYFPKHQIHIVSGEELVSSPAEVLQGVQHFLGLQPLITERHFYFNSTKGFPCIKKHGRSGRPHCLGKNKGRRHPQLPAHQLKLLADFYKPFNQKFYAMTGRDFKWEAPARSSRQPPSPSHI